MNRPLYESANDLSNERRVAEILEQHKYILHKLPAQYGLDVVIHDAVENAPVAFGEIKARTFPMNKFSTAMVNLHKVVRAKQLTDTTGLPSYLIVLWTDALARISFEADHSLQMGGRTDRGDPQDSDICAYYPIEGFKILSRF